MLKMIGWVIKASVFAAMVLVIGNYLRVGNKTVSDQVKTQLSHAERSEVVGEVKDWAKHVTTDHNAGQKIGQQIDHSAEIIKKGLADAQKSAKAATAKTRILPNMKPNMGKDQSSGIKTANEEIPSSERQKLQSLMRELNSARQSN